MLLVNFSQYILQSLSNGYSVRKKKEKRKVVKKLLDFPTCLPNHFHQWLLYDVTKGSTREKDAKSQSVFFFFSHRIP